MLNSRASIVSRVFTTPQVFAEHDTISIHDSFFYQCTNSHDGGACHISRISSAITIGATHFAECSATGEKSSGGAIMITNFEKSTVFDGCCFFTCQAGSAGQSFVSLASKSSLKANDITIDRCATPQHNKPCSFSVEGQVQFKGINISRSEGSYDVGGRITLYDSESTVYQVTIFSCLAADNQLWEILPFSLALQTIRLDQWNIVKNRFRNYMGCYLDHLAGNHDRCVFIGNSMDTSMKIDDESQLKFTNCKSDKPFLPADRFEQSEVVDPLRKTIDIPEVFHAICYRVPITDTVEPAAKWKIVLVIVFILLAVIGGGIGGFFYTKYRKEKAYAEALTDYTDANSLLKTLPNITP